MKVDTPEEIRACLSCQLPRCINCLDDKHNYGREYAETKKRPRYNGGPVSAHNAAGEEVMRFASAAQAAKALNVASGTIRTALREGCRCKKLYWRLA